MIIRPESSTLRIKRGTRYADIPANPPPPLADLESAFQYAEYLSLKVRHDPHDLPGLVNVPISENEDGAPVAGSSSGGPRKGNERDLWVYEHLRRLPIDLTPLVTSFLTACTTQTCPKMKADEWQYLCVAYGQEGAEECSAIDYILHTLDSTTALLNSDDIFPSRIQIPQASLSHFPSLFRRLSRIFSHAYYHHRELFQLAEAETSLYARFVMLCERYDLVSENLLVIPRSVVAEAIDGRDPQTEVHENRDDGDEDDEEGEEDDDEEEEEEEEEDEEEEEHEPRSRRDKEEGNGGRQRPHSLDRHPRPHKLDDLRQKGGETIRGKLTGAEASEQSALPDPRRDEGCEKTIAPLPGRKSRGTMLWTSDSDPAPTPTPTSTSDSNSEPAKQSIPDQATAELQAAPARPEEEEEVPKDEIELLEEQGVIPPISAVSPLPPPGATDASEGGGEGEGEMHEVTLDTPTPAEAETGEEVPDKHKTDAGAKAEEKPQESTLQAEKAVETADPKAAPKAETTDKS